MNIEKYDVAIICCGSGNSIITPFWDDKKVAIIDSGTFGGTCLNAGCIPTKMFAYPAQLAASSEDAKRLGVELDFVASDWPAIRDRIFSRIDAISAGGENYRDVELENNSIISDTVHFSGTKLLSTDTRLVIDVCH